MCTNSSTTARWAAKTLLLKLAPLRSGGTITGFSVQNYSYVYYTTTLAPLHQMLYNNIDWTDIDLTPSQEVQRRGPAVWLPSPQPGIAHLLHGYGNPALHQIFNTNGTNWQDQDLTDITDGTLGPLLTRDGRIQHRQLFLSLFCISS